MSLWWQENIIITIIVTIIIIIIIVTIAIITIDAIKPTQFEVV